MVIKKRLMVENRKEVNAAMIYDEGEEYPVLLASLINTVYFPQLIESGYKLTHLPYGFIKDGQRFDTLPCEVYNASTEELERMYYSIGTPTPNDELKKHIDVSQQAGMQLPPTKYTINTRDEFLAYLDASSKTNNENDFLPINYFVAPEARFTRDEFTSTEYSTYVKIMEDRRNMPLHKFRKLVKFLQKLQLLGANPSDLDILDAYFAWGIDGLQFTILSRTRKTTTYRMLADQKAQDLPMMKFTVGMIDGLHNVLTADIDRGDNWKLPSNESDYIDMLTRGLSPDQTTIVDLHANCLQDTTTLEGNLYNIRYSTDVVIVLGTVASDPIHTLSTLHVQSPGNGGESIPLTMALPANEDRLLTHCVLKSLANLAQSKRKPGWDVSSYKALTVNGLSYKNAINYIISKLGMRRPVRSEVQQDDAMPEVTYAMVDSYVAGDSDGLTDIAADFIDKVIEGIVNVDKTAAGKDSDARQSADLMFKQLYAIHHILGVPLEEMYTKILTISESVTSLEFAGNNLRFTLNVSPIRYSLNGWRADVSMYSNERAQSCTHYIYVLRVAGEVSDGIPQRHVGMEFLLVNMAKYHDVSDIIDQLERAYTDRVESTIADERERRAALSRSRLFAYRAFIEIYLRGTVTLPAKYFPGQTLSVNPEWVQVARKRVELKIESLEAFCGLSANAYNTNDLRFMSFCVNAYVTPDFVIPADPGNPIPMAPFYALWVNWRDTNPAVFGQLVEKGVLPQDFVAWSMRYYNMQYKQRSYDDLDEDDSLMGYYNRAVDEVQNWPANKVFTAVSHPCEYMYPGLYEDGLFGAEAAEDLPVPRQGAPVVRLGQSALLRYEDFQHKLNPINMLPEPDIYIKKFTGFPVEALLRTPDILEKLPYDRTDITIMSTSNQVYLPDTQQVTDFTNIATLDATKYAVNHLYDRTYIVRGSDGGFWEVRV